MLFCLLGDRECGVVELPVGYKHNIELWESQMATLRVRKVYSSLEVTQNLFPGTRPNHR